MPVQNYPRRLRAPKENIIVTYIVAVYIYACIVYAVLLLFCSRKKKNFFLILFVTWLSSAAKRTRRQRQVFIQNGREKESEVWRLSFKKLFLFWSIHSVAHRGDVESFRWMDIRPAAVQKIRGEANAPLARGLSPHKLARLPKSTGNPWLRPPYRRPTPPRHSRGHPTDRRA